VSLGVAFCSILLPVRRTTDGGKGGREGGPNKDRTYLQGALDLFWSLIEFLFPGLQQAAVVLVEPLVLGEGLDGG